MLSDDDWCLSAGSQIWNEAAHVLILRTLNRTLSKYLDCWKPGTSQSPAPVNARHNMMTENMTSKHCKQDVGHSHNQTETGGWIEKRQLLWWGTWKHLWEHFRHVKELIIQPSSDKVRYLIGLVFRMTRRRYE